MVPAGLAVPHRTAGHAGNRAEALVALHVVAVDVVQRRGGRGCGGRGHELAMVLLLVQSSQPLALRQLKPSAAGGRVMALSDAGSAVLHLLLLGLPLLLLVVLHVILVHHVRVDHLHVRMVGGRLLAVVLLELLVLVLVLEPHSRHASVAAVEESRLHSAVRVLPLLTLIISAQVRHQGGGAEAGRVRQLGEALQRVVEVPLVI